MTHRIRERRYEKRGVQKNEGGHGGGSLTLGVVLFVSSASLTASVSGEPLVPCEGRRELLTRGGQSSTTLSGCHTCFSGEAFCNEFRVMQGGCKCKSTSAQGRV